MNKIVVCLLLAALSCLAASAEPISPSTDVLTKNVDGEYVTIFGPDSFYSDLSGFYNPLVVVNGTAIIGGK